VADAVQENDIMKALRLAKAWAKEQEAGGIVGRRLRVGDRM